MPGGNTGEQVQTYGRISHHLLRDLHLTALIDLHNKCLDNPDKHLGAIISCKNFKCSFLTSESPILPAHSWLVGAWNLGGVRARLCPAILPWHATKSRLVPTCAHHEHHHHPHHHLAQPAHTITGHCPRHHHYSSPNLELHICADLSSSIRQCFTAIKIDHENRNHF